MNFRLSAFSRAIVAIPLVTGSLVDGFSADLPHDPGAETDPTLAAMVLKAPFQKMEAQLASDGLWIQSKETFSERFRVMATDVGREKRVHQPLAELGSLSANGESLSLIRPGVVEEYSASMDGIRQDFLVTDRPAGNGHLVLNLATTGAQVEGTPYGAQLTLPRTGRKIAYSRLHVTDAQGNVLKAQLVVPDTSSIMVVVDDVNATYPIRIDPTFSDADWISMGGFPGANDSVSALIVAGSGNLYAGGNFTAIGSTAANYVAMWDGSEWSALGTGTDESVEAFAISGNNLYVGGGFSSAGGSVASNVAMWDGTNWSALGSGLDSSVLALTMFNNELHAGGWFDNSGATPTSAVARWDGNNWQPLGTGLENNKTDLFVSALFANGNDLIVGGSFRTAGAVTALNIARWNGTEWFPMGDGLGDENASTEVFALAVMSGELYAGGDFDQSGALTVNNIAKWSGSGWAPIGGGVDNGVSAFAVDGTTLYVGGSFRNAGGITARYLAAWNGSNWSETGSGMESYVSSIALHNGALYAAGGFEQAGGLSAQNIAKLESGTWSSLGSGFNASVQAIAIEGTDVYAGGWFTASPGGPANHVAKWNGSSWSALGDGVNNTVRALAVMGTDLYAGGDFDMAGGNPANKVAKWNGTSWSALGSGMSGDALTSVRALALIGNDLYAGGFFDDAGAVTANGIAKWDGNNWSALGSGVGASGPFPFALVAALAASGTDLYVGGEFGTANGVTVNNIAKWNGVAWAPLGSGMAFGSEPFASVAALAISGNDVYAGGLFTEAGGVPANSVAKWNGSTWTALGSGIESMDPSSGETFVGEAEALTMIDGELVIGGFISTAGGVPAKNIAKWDGINWSAIGSGTDSAVRALGGTTTGVFVGGSFDFAGSKLSPYFAFVRTPLSYSGPYVVLANGDATIYLLVPSAGQYDIQRSTDLTSGNWGTIGSATATEAGVISFDDTNLSTGNAYYQAVQTAP